jgi:hypothetical protein
MKQGASGRTHFVRPMRDFLAQSSPQRMHFLSLRRMSDLTGASGTLAGAFLVEDAFRDRLSEAGVLDERDPPASCAKRERSRRGGGDRRCSSMRVEAVGEGERNGEYDCGAPTGQLDAGVVIARCSARSESSASLSESSTTSGLRPLMRRLELSEFSLKLIDAERLDLDAVEDAGEKPGRFSSSRSRIAWTTAEMDIDGWQVIMCLFDMGAKDVD